MGIINKNKNILIVGVGILILISFLLCSHSIPVDHDGGQHTTSDCVFVISGLSTISKTLLGIAIILFFLGLNFLSNFYKKNKFFKLEQNILNSFLLRPLIYPPNSSLFEAFRKGIIHSKIYPFVVV